MKRVAPTFGDNDLHHPSAAQPGREIGYLRVIVFALCGLLLAPGASMAQTDPVAPGQGIGGKLKTAGSGTADLVAPDNGGVAGTGLGKLPKHDTTGTGMSVKGPNGQGIDTGLVKPPAK